MKKAERKQLQKAIKENIKANLVLVLQQTISDLGSVNAKFEKQILKGSNKLAKKLAKFIRPAEPSEKAMLAVAKQPVAVVYPNKKAVNKKSLAPKAEPAN